ncbi:MAG: hypothetical protein WC942_09725 [Clostridia bacterium]|jgi:hypothetical protein
MKKKRCATDTSRSTACRYPESAYLFAKDIFITNFNKSSELCIQVSMTYHAIN